MGWIRGSEGLFPSLVWLSLGVLPCLVTQAGKKQKLAGRGPTKCWFVIASPRSTGSPKGRAPFHPPCLSPSLLYRPWGVKDRGGSQGECRFRGVERIEKRTGRKTGCWERCRGLRGQEKHEMREDRLLSYLMPVTRKKGFLYRKKMFWWWDTFCCWRTSVHQYSVQYKKSLKNCNIEGRKEGEKKKKSVLEH